MAIRFMASRPKDCDGKFHNSQPLHIILQRSGPLFGLPVWQSSIFLQFCQQIRAAEDMEMNMNMANSNTNNLHSALQPILTHVRTIHTQLSHTNKALETIAQSQQNTGTVLNDIRASVNYIANHQLNTSAAIHPPPMIANEYLQPPSTTLQTPNTQWSSRTTINAHSNTINAPSQEATHKPKKFRVSTASRIDPRFHYFLKEACTVEKVWEEYYHGINGQTSVKDLEALGKEWRNYKNGAKEYNKRRPIYLEIDDLMGDGTSEEDAVAKVDALHNEILTEKRVKSSRTIKALIELAHLLKFHHMISGHMEWYPRAEKTGVKPAREAKPYVDLLKNYN